MSDIFTLENFVKCINITMSPLLNCTPEIRNKRWGIAHITLSYMYYPFMFNCLHISEIHHSRAEKYIPDIVNMLSVNNTTEELMTYIKDNPNLEREELAFIYYNIARINHKYDTKIAEEYYNKAINCGHNASQYYLIALYSEIPNYDIRLLFNKLIKLKDSDIILAKYAYVSQFHFIRCKKILFNTVYVQSYLNKNVHKYLLTIDEATMPGYYLMCKWMMDNIIVNNGINSNELLDKLTIGQLIEYYDYLMYLNAYDKSYIISLVLRSKYAHHNYNIALTDYNTMHDDSATELALSVLKEYNTPIIRNNMYFILSVMNKSNPEKCFDYFAHIDIKYKKNNHLMEKHFIEEFEKGYHNIHRIKWTTRRHRYLDSDNDIVICILLCAKHRNKSRYPIPSKSILLTIYGYLYDFMKN